MPDNGRSDPMSDGFWLDVQDKRVAELEAEIERLSERLDSIETHYANHAADDYGAWLLEVRANAR